MDTSIKFALELADKSIAYSKQRTSCPECKAMQVQLVSWFNDAEWKCRKCKHKWSNTG